MPWSLHTHLTKKAEMLVARARTGKDGALEETLHALWEIGVKPSNHAVFAASPTLLPLLVRGLRSQALEPLQLSVGAPVTLSDCPTNLACLCPGQSSPTESFVG